MGAAVPVQVPRGPNPYRLPAGFVMPDLDAPPPFTQAQLERFFRTIPGTDVRDGVIRDCLTAPSLRALLGLMTLALGDSEWGRAGGFKTSPPLPKPDSLTEDGGNNQFAGGSGGVTPSTIHTVMQ